MSIHEVWSLRFSTPHIKLSHAGPPHTSRHLMKRRLIVPIFIAYFPPKSTRPWSSLCIHCTLVAIPIICRMSKHQIQKWRVDWYSQSVVLLLREKRNIAFSISIQISFYFFLFCSRKRTRCFTTHVKNKFKSVDCSSLSNWFLSSLSCSLPTCGGKTQGKIDDIWQEREPLENPLGSSL